jgi:hypothetical protein
LRKGAAKWKSLSGVIRHSTAREGIQIGLGIGRAAEVGRGMGGTKNEAGKSCRNVTKFPGFPFRIAKTFTQRQRKYMDNTNFQISQASRHHHGGPI